MTRVPQRLVSSSNSGQWVRGVSARDDFPFALIPRVQQEGSPLAAVAPDDRGHSPVCVYVGMRFYAVFLLPTLGMPADTLEYEVGEQEYGCRVCSFQPIGP